MVHRLSTWWRALAVAVVVVGPFTMSTVARGATPTPLRVEHQDAVITLGHHGAARLSISLQVPKILSHANASLTFYPAVTNRNELAPIISGQGVRGPSVGSAHVVVGCVQHRISTFHIMVFTQRPVAPNGPCATTSTAMRLRCASQGCGGVYPIRLTVGDGANARTRWSLVAVNTGASQLPIKVALINTLDAHALETPRTIAVLNALAQFPNVPIFLATNYSALSQLELSQDTTSPINVALKAALASPQHQVLNMPPGQIDYAGLLRNKLINQVHDQLNLTDNLVESLTGRYTAGPILLSGSPSAPSVRAIAAAGATQLVVPEGLLTSAPSSTLTWGNPFHLSGVPSALALSTDGPLSQLMTDTAIDPGRRAAMTLATLDFLHFEAPNDTSSRTVVLSAPITGTSSTYTTDLLQGLSTNPFLQLSSLSPSFESSLVGTNGSPATMSLSRVINPSWSSHNVDSLLTLVGRINSFAPAVSSPTERIQLRVAVAASEVVGSASSRQSAINSAANLLTTQIQHFAVDPSTITLAGTGTSLPVTIINHAGYSVTGVVHLITDRLTFPKSSSVAVALISPTNTVRIPVTSAQGSSLTLQVVVTTPNDQLVLARAAIQVRIAGNSIVGYLLTAASIIVLAWWWWRTNRRRSRGQHVR